MTSQQFPVQSDLTGNSTTKMPACSLSISSLIQHLIKVIIHEKQGRQCLDTYKKGSRVCLLWFSKHILIIILLRSTALKCFCQHCFPSSPSNSTKLGQFQHCYIGHKLKLLFFFVAECTSHLTLNPWYGICKLKVTVPVSIGLQTLRKHRSSLSFHAY